MSKTGGRSPCLCSCRSVLAPVKPPSGDPNTRCGICARFCGTATVPTPPPGPARSDGMPARQYLAHAAVLQEPPEYLAATVAARQMPPFPSLPVEAGQVSGTGQPRTRTCGARQYERCRCRAGQPLVDDNGRAQGIRARCRLDAGNALVRPGFVQGRLQGSDIVRLDRFRKGGLEQAVHGQQPRGKAQ